MHTDLAAKLYEKIGNDYYQMENGWEFANRLAIPKVREVIMEGKEKSDLVKYCDILSWSIDNDKTILFKRRHTTVDEVKTLVKYNNTDPETIDTDEAIEYFEYLAKIVYRLKPKGPQPPIYDYLRPSRQKPVKQRKLKKYEPIIPKLLAEAGASIDTAVPTLASRGAVAMSKTPETVASADDVVDDPYAIIAVAVLFGCDDNADDDADYDTDDDANTDRESGAQITNEVKTSKVFQARVQLSAKASTCGEKTVGFRITANP